MKKRILCIGITSSHAWPVYSQLCEREDIELYGIRPARAKKPVGARVYPIGMDDYEGMRQKIQEINPTHIMHAGGVCDLDRFEADPDSAYAINVGGTRNICEAALDAYILYCSADLIFSGINPPAEGYHTESVPDPVSIIGKTIAGAELEMRKHPHAGIVRVALPMGASVQGYKGAVDFIESRFKKKLPVTLFHNEWRSAIHTDELGRIIIELLFREETGVYHAGGPEPVSLYRMGEVILGWGDYDPLLLKGMHIHEEVDGPPRVHNVHMDSRPTYDMLGWKARPWPDKETE